MVDIAVLVARSAGTVIDQLCTKYGPVHPIPGSLFERDERSNTGAMRRARVHCPLPGSSGRPGAWQEQTGAEYFTAPRHPNQRRYEALRAYFTGGLTVAEAGARAGCTRSAMASLLRDFRAGKLELFAPPGKPGQAAAGARQGAGDRPAPRGPVGL